MTTAVALGQATLTWQGTAPEEWNTATTGPDRPWLDAGNGARFEDGDIVIFGSTGDRIVSITAGATVSTPSMTFTEDGYTIQGGTISSFDDGGMIPDALTITVDPTFAATISSVIQTNDATGVITKDGTGTLNLSGNSSGMTGTFAVSEGTVNLTGNLGDATSAVTVATNGTLNANGGIVAGQTTSNGGTVTINGTEFSLGVLVNSGATTVTGNSTVGLLNNAGGTVAIDSGVTLTGNVSNTDNADVDIPATTNNGTITGNVTVSAGTFNAENGSRVQGDTITLDGGELVANGGQFGVDDMMGDSNSNDSTITVTNSATLDVNAATTVNVVNNGGIVELDAAITGDVSNTGATNIDNAQTITGNVTNSGAGTFTNQSGGLIDGNLTVSNGVFDAQAGSRVEGDTITLSGGELVANGGQFGVDDMMGDSNSNDSTITVTNAATLDVDAATTVNIVNNGGIVELDAAITGDVSNIGATNIANAQTITGTVTNSGTGSFTNQSGGSIDGNLTVSNGVFDAETGSRVVGPTVSVTGGRLEADGGAFGSVGAPGANGDATITTTLTGTLAVTNTTTVQNVVNDGGTVTIDAGDRLNVDTFRNTMNAGTSTNNGILAGNLVIEGGIFNAQGGSVVLDNSITFSAGQLNANGGTFGTEVTPGVSGTANNDAAFTVTGTGTLSFGAATTFASATNQNGTLNITANVTGDVSNTGTGTTTSSAQIDGQVVVSDGTFNANGSSSTTDTDVEVSGGILNAAGGTFGTAGNRLISLSDGEVNINADTEVDVTTTGGDLIVAATRTLTGDVTLNDNGSTDAFIVTNNGTIIGQLNVTDGTFVAVDGSHVTDLIVAVNTNGTLTASGGTFGTLNMGVPQNDGTIQVTTGGTLNFADTVARSTTVDVTNQGGTVSIGADQTVVGDLTSSNIASQSTITGTLEGNLAVQAGQVTVTGRVTDDDTLVTGGTLTSNGGTFTTTAPMTPTGTVSVDGSGAFIVGAGTTTANAEIDGGAMTVNGALSGTALLSSGTLTNNAGGSISSLTTVTNGTLNAEGGAFTGGLVLNGGTINLNENTTAAITNNAVNPLTIGNVQITGDFTQGAGTTNNAGDIVGGLTFSGNGTFNNNTNGSISEEAVVTQGTIGANGGSFDGGLTVGGGATVNITASTTGDINNGRVLNGLIPAIDGLANLQINNGVTITGDVTNANGAGAGITLGGTVDGALNVNTGIVTVDGTGRVTEATNVNGGVLTSNGGTFGTDGGATDVVTVTGTGSTFNVIGSGVTTTGNVVSAQGVVDIATGAILDGNVVMNDVVAMAADAGSVTNDGTIRGTLTMNDGTFTAMDGSTVQGAATASNGTLNLSGGDFDNGLTVSGNVDVVITAETEADITNNGVAGVTNDQIIIGDFTQQAGDTTNTGDLRGLTTVTGGTLTNDTNGLLTGDANVTGGFLNNNGTAAITGKTTVSGASALAEGTVAAAGGTFGDGASPAGGPLNDVDIEVQQFGNLNVTASTSADVTNSGGDVGIAAGQQLTGNFVSSDDNAVTTVDGQIVGNITLSDGTVTLQTATGLPFAGVAVQGDVNATSGTLNIADGTTVNGGVGISGDANLNVAGTVNINPTNNGGTMEFTSGDVVDGNVTTNAGTTNNNGGTINGNIVVTQNIANPPSVFNNTGTTNSDTVSVSGGTLNNNTPGGVMNSDLFTVTGGTLNANGGTFADKAGTGTATLGVSSNGELNINANTTADVTNAGNGEVNVSAQLTGSVTNAGTINANANAIFTETIANNGGGDVNIVGNTTGNVANNGGDLTVNGGQKLTGTVTNTNANSDTRVNANAEIEGNVTVSNGTVTNLGTLDGTVAVTGGTVTSSGTVEGNTTVSAGVVNNSGLLDGTVGVSGSGTLSDTGGRVSGVVTQTGGTINANGTTFDQTVANNGGQMTTIGNTSGNVTSTGGDLTVASGSLTGDVTVQSAASDMINNGTVNGDVTVTAGSVTNTGRINGDVVALSTGLTNPATVTTTGTIDGTVQLGATLAPSTILAPSTVANGSLLNADAGNITGLVTNNGGTVEANGATFDAGIQNNLGDVNINTATTVTGTVENAGGTLTVDNTLTTTVNQRAGATENNGTIGGLVNLSGGLVEQNSGSDTTGLTTLSGGVLQANGGAFSGGIRTTGGTLNINADTAADIENDGANLDLTAGRVITGDFDNTSGTAALNGTMNGTVNIDSGIVNTAGSTTVTGTTNLRDGALVTAGGTFDGRINTFDGTMTIAGDTSVAGDVVNRGADVTVNATLAGNLNQQSGTSTINDTVDGNLTVASGTATNAGTVTGRTTVSGGTFQTEAGSIVSGATTITSGTLTAQGGTFAGDIANDGGAVNVSGGIVADIQNTSGSLSLDGASAVVAGDIVNQGTLGSVDGTITGNLTNGGTANVTTGDLNVNSFANSGTMNVTDGNTLTATSTGTVSGTGTLAVDNATVVADLTAAEGATVTLNRATVDGDFVNNTNLAPVGGLDVTGDLTVGSTGSLVLNEGALDVGGVFDLAADSENRLESDTTISAARINNLGTLNTVGNAQINGTFLNAGTFNAGGAAATQLSFGGEVTNTATINGQGTIVFQGGLVNEGTLDLTNGDTSDRVEISGSGLSGNGQLRFDINLTEGEASSDRITLAEGAFLTGEVNLSFTVVGGLGEQDEDVVVIDVADNDPGNFTLTPISIVEPSGILAYSLARNADGDVVIEDGLNPGIAGLAGNIVLTQSLIGSVVNRPSSPFVSGLAYEDEDPCGYGVWARAIGGLADSTGSVTQGDSSGRAFDGTISADYYGVQLGTDYACFNGAIDGWDLAIGGIMGINSGSTSQPVFAIDTENDDNFSNVQTSTTNVDFDQIYAGVYATAVKGPYAFDLQYRLENTDFSATNVGAIVNGIQLPGLGLSNTEFSSEASTLSGAVSYFYNIPESDLTFVPTAGFAYTQISTDPINFNNRGVVTIEDFDSQIGFVGGTIARSKFGDDGVSATRQFISATVYSDFADGPDSVFTPADDSGERSLGSDNLGTYGEVSVGWNYVRILQPGELGNMKQLSSSVRADARYSDRLDSYGVTAQMRFQF